MSSPFRSEIEQLQERLRRMEDQKRELEDLVRVREEKLRQKSPTRRGLWAIATFAIAVASWTFGAYMTSVDATKQRNAADAIARASYEHELEICKGEGQRHALELQRAKWDLTMCTALPKPSPSTMGDRSPAPPPGTKATVCKCVPGDPLCLCL
jgi:hypothetical protein